jgi:hypothetical protein
VRQVYPSSSQLSLHPLKKIYSSTPIIHHHQPPKCDEDNATYTLQQKLKTNKMMSLLFLFVLPSQARNQVESTSLHPHMSHAENTHLSGSFSR